MAGTISRAGQYGVWATLSLQDMSLSPSHRRHVVDMCRRLHDDPSLELVGSDDRVQEIVQSYAQHMARLVTMGAEHGVLIVGLDGQVLVNDVGRMVLDQLVEEADGGDDVG